MSELTVAKVIESDEVLSESIVIKKIEKALEKEFDKAKIIDKEKQRNISCRVKTKLLNPIVSIKGPITVEANENKAKVMIDAKTKTNGWFWFTALIGCFFPLFWALMLYMYFTQKQSSEKCLQKVFERIEFDFKKI